MREFPILFSTPMVQAILAGNKTQTRRIIRPQPDDSGLWNGTVDETGESKEFKCRFGKIGTILWVRETWNYDPHKNVTYIYKAQGENQSEKWKPSIFMPKEACRIRLEITDIRVERLQNISEEDAMAEGVGYGFQMNAEYPDYEHIKNGICILTQDTAEMSFASLWDSINFKRASWKSNPWVWKIEFKKL